ncbi:hypothetical protein [Candidatus Soleaferrea massiliensis]|uniref:hypothetical protein n=1 Tax=Candidatus Soleaferrea massiliensis TaxID=1470354 RepID=UPI0012DFEBB6|nr:hypothetical protein [Candidatus Soleaferrea massiliensis]
MTGIKAGCSAAGRSSSSKQGGYAAAFIMINPDGSSSPQVEKRGGMVYNELKPLS